MDREVKKGAGSAGNSNLLVPILIFFGLLIFAVIRGPNLISSAGIGSAMIVVAPLVLATYALTIIVMSGRASVDLSIGPLIGFINVGMIQLHAVGFMESPIAFFLYAMGVGVAYQLLQGLIIIFVRVQPIIVSLSGYLALVGLNLVILPRPGGVAPDWMFDWGSGTSIFSAVLVILAIATAGWYILAQTSFFGHLRLMGSDERAAYSSGVRINFVRLGAHAIGGIYAGLAAITFTSLISSGDPTQGTTYTLMAVTALVLGGANLAGGRGGAFGSLLGALNIYLITYALSTFSFGMVQSFVTDLAYGVMLVLSLLISVAVPHIQKHIRGLSPLVFFAILSVIALGVILHMSLDQTIAPLAGVSSSSIVFLSDGGVAQGSGSTGAGYSPGTYILFIIIAAVGLVYLFHTLFRNFNAPMIGLVVVIAATALGLVFNPDTPAAEAETPVAAAEAPSGMDAFQPRFFALQSMEGTGDVSGPVENVSYLIAIITGVVLFSSLLILVALPQVTLRTKRVAMFLFAAALAVVAVGSLFFDGLDGGYLPSTLTGEVYGALLIGLLLFIVTAPLVHTRLRNVSHVFIAAMSVLAITAVYFGTEPGEGLSDTSEAGYARQILAYNSEAPSPGPSIGYAEPARVNVGTDDMPLFGKLATCAIIIVLLHIFLRIAMREASFRSFWRYWHIVVVTALLWGALFYAIGVPLWQILAVILVAMFSAPNVMHIISTYRNNQRRDDAISQWSG